MKKTLCAISIASALTLTFTAGVFAEGIAETISAYLCPNVVITVDGTPLTIPEGPENNPVPIIYNDCVYLPYSYVSVVSGLESSYDPSTNAITYTTPQPPAPTEPFVVTDNRCWVVNSPYGYSYLVSTVTVMNNTQSNAYVESATFDIEDETGAIIGTSKYVSGTPQVIKPGESVVYYDEMLSEKTITTGTFKVVPTVRLKETSLEAIRCPVSEVTIADSRWGGVEIVGRVENTTGADQAWMDVDIVLYDANGKVIGVESTYLGSVTAGSKIGFEARTSSNLKIQAKDISSYEIYVYPTQYDWGF